MNQIPVHISPIVQAKERFDFLKKRLWKAEWGAERDALMVELDRVAGRLAALTGFHDGCT